MFYKNRHEYIKNFCANMPLLISLLALSCLLITILQRMMYVWGIVCLGILVLSFFARIEKGYVKNNLTRSIVIAALTVGVGLGCYFYYTMSMSSLLKKIVCMIGINHKIPLLCITVIGVVCAVYFLMVALLYIHSKDFTKFIRFIEQSGYLDYMAIALAILGLFLAIFFSFNGYIWADEAYSLRITQYSWQEIIAMCAADVHPPLYYLLLNLIEEIGHLFSVDYYSTVVIGKLVSVLPYFLLSIFCWIKFNDLKDIRPYVILCVYGMSPLIDYSIEIRMYSWGLLFVTVTFLYARDIIRGRQKMGNWIFLVFFSILSAYTHTFALVAVASVWLCLLIWSFIYERKLLFKWIVFGMLVAICFFPWLLVLVRQVGYVAESYWIAPITWKTFCGFVIYIFPGFMLLIFPILFTGIESVIKNSNKQGVLQEGMGIFIPIITILVGVVVSAIVRPVFVSRYIIPTIMCVWISVLLLAKKCNYNVRFIVFIMIFAKVISSYSSFAINEFKTKVDAKENIALVESFEEEAIVIISGSTLTADTVASYTDHMVYNWNGPELNTAVTKYRGAYQNEDIFDDISQIDKWIAEDIPMYYVEVSDSTEENLLPHDENKQWDLECIGNYSFGADTTVYKIVMK